MHMTGADRVIDLKMSWGESLATVCNQHIDRYIIHLVQIMRMKDLVEYH